ncbi:MAG: ABC transporter permease [Deltaproteobacteria bacterium]|nr:ABC transporter permease [Deltaproteobacteria bacterium]
MIALDFLRMAGQSLLQNRRRSALSLLGVVIGVVAVTSLTAIGEGALRYVNDQFASLGSSIIVIAPGRNETTGGMPVGIGGMPNDLTLEDARHLGRRISAVREAIPVSASSGKLRHGGRNRQVPMIGTVAAFERMQRLELASGSFLPAGDMSRGASVVVLGHKVAQELFGRENALGQTVRFSGSRMRVIGVLAERGTQLGLQIDESVFAPVSTVMRLANKSSLTRVMLDLAPRSDQKRVIEQVKRLLIERHDEEDFTCISQDAIMASLSSILRILTLAVAGIAAISLAVAGIGIMNVMLVAVSERTDEVGLMKAVGASRRQILVLFLCESALLSIAGGALGLGLGTALVAFGRSLYPAIDLATPTWAIAAVLGLSLGTGILFGVLPAWRAARLDPVDALRGH